MWNSQSFWRVWEQKNGTSLLKTSTQHEIRSVIQPNNKWKNSTLTGRRWYNLRFTHTHTHIYSAQSALSLSLSYTKNTHAHAQINYESPYKKNMVGDNKRWSMQFNGLRMWMTQRWEEDVGDILQLTISARFRSYTRTNLLPGCLTAAALATGTLCLTCQQSVTTPCLLVMSGWFISLLMLYAKAMACLTHLPIWWNVFSFTVNTIFTELNSELFLQQDYAD